MPAGRRKRQKRGTGPPGAAAGPARVPLPGPRRSVRVRTGCRRSWCSEAIIAAVTRFFPPVVSYIASRLSTAGGPVLGLVRRLPAEASMPAGAPLPVQVRRHDRGLGNKKTRPAFRAALRRLGLFFPSGDHFFDLLRCIIRDCYALDADGRRRDI